MERWASSGLIMPMARESSMVYFFDFSLLSAAPITQPLRKENQNKTKHFLLLPPVEKLNQLTLLCTFLLSLVPRFFMVLPS